MRLSVRKRPTTKEPRFGAATVAVEYRQRNDLHQPGTRLEETSRILEPDHLLRRPQVERPFLGNLQRTPVQRVPHPAVMQAAFFVEYRRKMYFGREPAVGTELALFETGVESLHELVSRRPRRVFERKHLERTHVGRQRRSHTHLILLGASYLHVAKGRENRDSQHGVRSERKHGAQQQADKRDSLTQRHRQNPGLVDTLRAGPTGDTAPAPHEAQWGYRLRSSGL